ncbi:MAG: 40S ribosomal protein mrp2, mitochondrial [Heterodermia speciosa]|uniref:40S ribosomal protein mrp2, mitochondrial n=1 Tax=Heterodermia speciosa TaxID=116794 RepID=A0A8H3IW97_9LECA|nr:MAG: 40S ribosomal protein mrp2, mitochondrial [Heterodermia speciosa]
MAQFRSKKLDLSGFVNIKIIRDHTKRKVVEKYETERYAIFTIRAALWNSTLKLLIRRQALRYIIRNTTLPGRTRAQAQLQLSQMHCYTRPTQIKNRCIEGGKGRGVLGKDFRMARYCFRLNALEGNIPGVRKASW